MQLTHLDHNGQVNMVSVEDKSSTKRYAIAEGKILVKPDVLALLKEGAPKGNVIATAKIAGIMGAKKTSELIPLCHNLNLDKVSVDVEEITDGLHVTSYASCEGKTGVEMEALTAVSIALLTIYDMLKAADKSMTIEYVRLTEKDGGKSGKYVREK
ncbi:MAG: cyclic pyranopterin monophosphate synthase MoaC [Clostridia bacterium]|nr:cyclic pyranopterin monophosphate synthase MoaC [Clostridia bacterium]